MQQVDKFSIDRPTAIATTVVTLVNSDLTTISSYFAGYNFGVSLSGSTWTFHDNSESIADQVFHTGDGVLFYQFPGQYPAVHKWSDFISDRQEVSTGILLYGVAQQQ